MTETNADSVTRALDKVFKQQEPFYASILNQMQAVEKRLEGQGADISEMKENVAVIINQELLQKFENVANRLTALESAENVRKGLILATTIMPKMIMVLVILVGAVLAYLKLPNAPSIIH